MFVTFFSLFVVVGTVFAQQGAIASGSSLLDVIKNSCDSVRIENPYRIGDQSTQQSAAGDSLNYGYDVQAFRLARERGYRTGNYNYQSISRIPVYTDFDARAKLGEEISSILEDVLNVFEIDTVSFQGRTCSLRPRFTIIDEDMKTKGWDWIFASEVQDTRIVQGKLSLQLLGPGGRLLKATSGLGVFDAREVKSYNYGGAFGSKFRYPNAHFLAANMVAAAIGISKEQIGEPPDQVPEKHKKKKN